MQFATRYQVGFEHFGDPEIEQLDLPLRRDEDVRRLKISVDDKPLVGVGNGAADLEKQF